MQGTRGKRTRLVVLVTSLVVMALPAPRAEANGIYTALFTGTLVLHAGLGFPCVPPTPGTAKCPAVVTPNLAPGKQTPLFTTNGNVRGGAFASGVCTDFGTWTLKAKPPGHTGACAVVSAFALMGFCGLAHGVGNAVIVDSSGQAHAIRYTFTITFTTLVLRGNALKSDGQVGDIHGTAAIIADPTHPGSCATKTATQFLLGGGHVSITYPKTLP